MGVFDKFFNTKKEPKRDEEVIVKEESDFSNFHLITEYIYSKSGIIDLDKRALPLSSLKRLAEKLELYKTNDFLKMMEEDSSFYQDVLNIITVNETFFFREVKEIEWLVKHISQVQKKFKILSLPCSSGEEVYSILILLDAAGIDLNRVDIIGYDINSVALQNAQNGIYSEHSLHKLSTTDKSKYFNKVDNNRYEIIQKYRERVTFLQKNIFELREKDLFDIVLSRNMFIYFDDVKRREALDIIVNSIKDGGYYIKGHADTIYNHPYLKNELYGIYAIDKKKH